MRRGLGVISLSYRTIKLHQKQLLHRLHVLTIKQVVEMEQIPLNNIGKQINNKSSKRRLFQFTLKPV